MTLPSPLRELAADIRPDDARSDVYAVSNAQLAAWAAKLESLAGEYAVVPREATEEMRRAAVIYANGNAVYKNVAAEVLRIEEGIYAEVYDAMIEAAERQETGR